MNCHQLKRVNVTIRFNYKNKKFEKQVSMPLGKDSPAIRFTHPKKGVLVRYRQV